MTLVEVVVASTVFALVMLATVTAFRTFGQAYQRLDQVTRRLVPPPAHLLIRTL